MSLRSRSGLTAALLVLALTASGCSLARGSAEDGAAPTSEPVAAPPIDPGTPSETDDLASPSPSPTGSPSTSPSPSASPEPTFAYDVVAVQEALQAQRYYVGPIDGEVGASMRSAVMAFQKINGLGADGVVGPKTLAALEAPKTPVLKGSGPSRRVEVDLGKQVLFYVEGGEIVRILPISSGSGATYRTKSGGKARSLTPIGWFKIQRKIDGIREADLGILYDPMYFYRGWAIHGSNSVPAYPASHGCIRVTRTDAKWLFPRLTIGTQVYLYGGTHVFTAGSDAPGTDNPAGDTPQDTASPSPSPSPTASPSPSQGPTAGPGGSPSPSPSDDPSPSEDPSSPEPSEGEDTDGSPAPSESPTASESPSEILPTGSPS